MKREPRAISTLTDNLSFSREDNHVVSHKATKKIIELYFFKFPLDIMQLIAYIYVIGCQFRGLNYG